MTAGYTFHKWSMGVTDCITLLNSSLTTWCTNLSQHKFCFAFCCVPVNRLSGSPGHRSCEQRCAVHSRPDSSISLNIAYRDLIKEPFSLLTNHRGLFKVCTCSRVSYVSNEGHLLHVFLVAPLFFWMLRSVQWGKAVFISSLGAQN